MRKLSPILLGLSFAVAGSSLAAAQQTVSLPKVLQITREYLKPYKGGVAHDKTESAFVQAYARAKFPAYYEGLNSMSGKSRALYLTMYNSFADWEKDNQLQDKNTALGADLERAGNADGELLDELDSGIFTRDEELSFHPHSDVSKAHYMEVEVFNIRPGHDKEWRDAVKLVKDAYEKAGTNAHWAMFEAMFGSERGTFVALTADESLAEIDTSLANGKKFGDALGEAGGKKLDELAASAIASWHNELFSVNPKQSYVSPDWIKADPDFWRPKAAAPPAKTALQPAAAAEKKPTP
jgi:hypothetical protein